MWWKLAGVLAAAALVLAVGLSVLKKPAAPVMEMAKSLPVPQPEIRPQAEEREIAPSGGPKPPGVNAPPPTAPARKAEPVPERDAANSLASQPVAVLPPAPAAVEPPTVPLAQTTPPKDLAAADEALKKQEPGPNAASFVAGNAPAPAAASERRAAPSPVLGRSSFGALATPRTFSAKVAGVEGTVVRVDAGSNAGLRTGDRLEIQRDGKVLATIRVSDVKETSAEGTFESPAREAPKAGDAVRRATSIPPATQRVQ